MADFEVLIYKINQPVVDHPDADRLSLVQIEGYTCISAKTDDGKHRYQEGDFVVYIPEGAVLPEWMMKKMDFWDVNKNKPAFRYVKAKKLRGIFSQGILYPVGWDDELAMQGSGSVVANETSLLQVEEGQDVSEFLGITRYEPPIPTTMVGQVSGAYINHTKNYDFESIQKHSRLFTDGEAVSVSEKIHGTLIQIGFVPELNDIELFNDNLFVTSKGMAKQGCVYKNLPANNQSLC